MERTCIDRKEANGSIFEFCLLSDGTYEVVETTEYGNRCIYVRRFYCDAVKCFNEKTK